MTDVHLLYHISHQLRDEPCPQHLDEDGDPLCDEQAVSQGDPCMSAYPDKRRSALAAK